ncbi:MAG: hypothetical protein U0641_09080 [Anaerolineae bacterium]
MDAKLLDHYLPAAVRASIEETYYAPINRLACLEALLQDANFLRDPVTHPGLFADHGVVHARDVTQQVLRLLEITSDVLIPARAEARRAFMASYGVMLAYVHDIGMADFSPFGRTMHPEVAAHIVFSAAFDEIVAAILSDDGNPVVMRLRCLAKDEKLAPAAGVALRELLALAVGHSKSKMPVGVLNDRQRLRQVMLRVVSTDLRLLYALDHAEKTKQAVARASAHGISRDGLDRLARTLAEAEHTLADSTARSSAAPRQADVLRRFYGDAEREPFAWLDSNEPVVRQMVDDVVDTIRLLRAADALRQRGSVLKTSGGYEVYVDQTTAHAIYGLRSSKGELFLLTAPKTLSAGEANVASSQVTFDGNLRISFHRGAFVTPDVAHHAAICAATVVVDIQRDVIQSFERAETPGAPASIKRGQDVLILLEDTDDNLAFGETVAQLIGELAPELQGRVGVAPSLEHVPALERARYLSAPELRVSNAARQTILEHIAHSGHNTQGIAPTAAFAHVRTLRLQRGETLLEAGSPPGFVYIPMSEGLRVYPLGGYESAAIPAWTPVGNTGVIRGAPRNATVKADETLSLLVIPKSIYLKHWHHPYTASELIERLAGEAELRANH